jgi:hypothetical protein
MIKRTSHAPMPANQDNCLGGDGANSTKLPTIAKDGQKNMFTNNSGNSGTATFFSLPVLEAFFLLFS